MAMPSRDWRACRHDANSDVGHYESWFVRANHPRLSEAFWIRYTIFASRGRASDAQGELWAVYFNGEQGVVRAARSEVPFGKCAFARAGLDLRIGSAVLRADHLVGEASGPASLSWNLRFGGGAGPVCLLPEGLYETRIPKAKSVTTQPFARFDGEITVDGTVVEIRDWIGSENHNWGSQHTDRYAWGQVVGFDDAPDAFLEVITARVKIGPLSLPPLTLLVLNCDGVKYRFNSVWTAYRGSGRWENLAYEFATRQDGVRVSGRIYAPCKDFIGLTYRNPPGGTKICLNTKIAACELRIETPDKAVRRLRSGNRAAFEILGDEAFEGIPTVV